MASDAANSLKYCDVTKIVIQTKQDLRGQYKSGANWNCRHLRGQDLYLISLPNSTHKAEIISLALNLLEIKAPQDVIDKFAKHLPPVPSALASPGAAALGAPPATEPTVTEFVPTPPPEEEPGPPPHQARRVWRPPDDSMDVFVDRSANCWEVRGPPAKVEQLRERIFRVLRDKARANIEPGKTQIRLALLP